MRLKDIVGRSSMGKLNTFVIGWLQLFEGLVGIFTLGFLYSSVSMNYLEWITKREMWKLMDEQIEKEEGEDDSRAWLDLTDLEADDDGGEEK